jgi:DNA-binding NtrC family response regulator
MERFVQTVDIIGDSPCIQELRATLRELSKSEHTVLFEGETGTGKDVAARYLHHCNPLGPFVHVDCGALEETLLASELFGHERGSFTGADQEKRGLIEVADSGTLFLDEIGELGLPQQRKVLTVLEKKHFRRIGSITHKRVAFRLVAATNRDLRAEVERGRFREDLFYRLNIIKIRIPPLRERCEDIPLLVGHFLKEFNREPLQDSCLSLLRSYSWPGNVRQLKACIQRMVALCGDHPPGAKHLPETVRVALGVGPSANGTIRSREYVANDVPRPSVDKTRLIDALGRSSGNISKAAELLGIGRTTFYRQLNKHSLTVSRQPSESSMR